MSSKKDAHLEGASQEHVEKKEVEVKKIEPSKDVDHQKNDIDDHILLGEKESKDQPRGSKNQEHKSPSGPADLSEKQLSLLTLADLNQVARRLGIIGANLMKKEELLLTILDVQKHP